MVTYSHPRSLKSAVLWLIVMSCCGGCAKPPTDAKAADDQSIKTVVRDLNIVGEKTVILETTRTDLGRPEMGLRDEAILLTRDETGYTLRYVFRFPGSGNPNFRRWTLWSNHDISEVGSGAEVPAMMTFSEMPSADEVAAFKSETLDHWSNRQ
jgi:hypothetical protein